jgi:hypothetical protein
MTTIGGPGGINGPKGPGGPRLDDDAGHAGEISATAQAGAAERTETVAATDLHALSAEVAAGRLTQREAIDRLADAMAGPDLDAEARAELRELIGDLVANDPYLGALAGRI